MIYLSLLDPRAATAIGACQRFVKVQRKGEWFDLGGESVEVFRIGTLAEAFGRAPRTLKEWEQAKLLPPPLFRVHGSSHRRYSAAQILNAHRLVQARWRDRRHVVLAEMQTLFDALRAIWYVPQVVVNDRGEVNEHCTAYLGTV